MLQSSVTTVSPDAKAKCCGELASLEKSSPVSKHQNNEPTSSLRGFDITNEIESLILPSRKQRLLTSSTEKLTFNKLRFDSVGLYGRDKEKSLLKERLSNVTPTAKQSRATSNIDNCKHCCTNNTQEKMTCGSIGIDSTNGKSTTELILLSGYSGTGKSKLASSITKKVLKAKGIFGYGKFDLNSFSQDEPYWGIAAVCSQICEVIMTSTKNNSDNTIQTTCAAAAAKEGVKMLDETELYLLAKIIPNFEQCFAVQKDSSGNNRSLSSDGVIAEAMSSANLLDTKAILLYAFRKFLRIVCNCFPPLVMVLDDVQWADSASLELLQELLTDQEINNLMVILCYRSNEVDDTHLLSKLVRNLKEEKSEKRQQHNQTDDNGCRGFTITELHIGNIDVQAANQVVMALLNLDDKPHETLKLAEICHKRTQGNIFFFLTFMEMLQEHKLLEFDLGRFCWTWNVEEIEKKTAATANVVGLLIDKIKKSSSGSNMARLLLLAACLGSAFEKHILHKVFTKVRAHPQTTVPSEVRSLVTIDKNQLDIGTFADFDELLNKAMDESFLEKVTSKNDSISSSEGNYRFVHDKVQEAATAAVTVDQLNRLQYQVGTVLLHELNEKELEDLIFVVVNLLNSQNQSGTTCCSEKAFGSEDDESNEKQEEQLFLDFIDIAKLNLRAAEKAKGMSAFASSARYASKGVKFLLQGNACENGHYKLYLDLYSTGAEVENCVGNTNQTQEYCKKALDLQNGGNSTKLDKLRVYKVMMDYMGSNGAPADATKLSVDVLKKLGYAFPCNKFSQGIALVKSISYLKSISAKKHVFSVEHILSLPLMSDECIIECAKLLDRAKTYSLLAKNSKLFPIISSHLIAMTIRYGICDSSVAGFACGGLILAQGFGDYDTAALYGELALTIQNRLQVSPSKSPSCAMYVVYACIEPYQNPLFGMENKLMQEYKNDLKYGDTESASYSICNVFWAYLVMGTSLNAIEEDCRIYLPQMRALKREEVSRQLSICHQLTLNLMGHSQDCTRLNGEALDEDEFRIYSNSTQSGFLVPLFKYILQFLYAYLGEYQLGAELAIARGDSMAKDTPVAVFNFHDPFIRGVSLYAMAQQTIGNYKKRRMYIRHAKKARSTIRSMAKKGNPNVVHYLKLLNAEHEALSGKFEQASKLYGEATTLAFRSGFVHDAALCNERYATFLFTRNTDSARQDAISRLEQASKYYSEWGARAKLAKL